MNARAGEAQAPDRADASERPTASGPHAKSQGPGKIIIVVYAIFSLSAGARALYQILAKFDAAPVSFALSGVAAAIYVVATVSLASRGLRAYWISVATICLELLGVVAVGVFSLIRPDLFPLASVWSHFGNGYGYVPLVLPVIGLAWLWAHRPATSRPSTHRPATSR